MCINFWICLVYVLICCILFVYMYFYQYWIIFTNRGSGHHHHHQTFYYNAGTGATFTSVGPLPGIWLAAPMVDLTSDLQVCLSWGSIAESFHSLQSLSVSCFHVNGPPRPTLSVNLYVKGCPDCTIRAFHMSIPAEPTLLQNEVQILNAKLRK